MSNFSLHIFFLILLHRVLDATHAFHPTPSRLIIAVGCGSAYIDAGRCRPSSSWRHRPYLRHTASSSHSRSDIVSLRAAAAAAGGVESSLAEVAPGGGEAIMITSPAPPIAITTTTTTTRRRTMFTDFGIASERAEPININGEVVIEQDSSGGVVDDINPRKFTGFSIEGRSRPFSFGGVSGGSSTDGKTGFSIEGRSRPFLGDTGGSSTDGNENDGAGSGGGVPATTTAPVSVSDDGQQNEKASGNDGAVRSTKDGGDASTAVTSVAEEEPPTVTSFAEEKPSAVTSVAKEKTSAVTSVVEEKPAAVKSVVEEMPLADDALVSTPKEQISTDQNNAMVVSKPSSVIIQTQQQSLPTINLPNIVDMDVEAFGLIPLIVIGISFSLALGMYFNQANDNNDTGNGNHDASGTNNEPGFLETSKNLLQQVKDAGVAGAISYALWEAAFWGVSVPVCLTSYYQITRHWPDLTSGEDARKLGLEAFAFVNFARLAVPIRVGLALSTIPWVEENILKRVNGIQDENDEYAEVESEEATIAASIENEQYLQENKAEEDGGVYSNTQFSYDDDIDMKDDGSLAASKVEDWLSQFETEVSRISSSALQKMNAGIDPALLQKKQTDTNRGDGDFGEYCEPGQVKEDCAEYIRGYLDTLASTGAVATAGEVKAIVGYLDSLSSNVTPNESTGEAFTNYLDALSTGYIPAPSSARAVFSYLDALSDVTTTSATKEVDSGPVGSRISEVEDRLNRLESSINNLPDDIASRLVEWQISQEKKMAEDTERIMKLLVEGKLLDK